MSLKLIFTEEAKKDYLETFEWYNQIDRELANSFSEELDRVFIRIQESSEQFPVIDGSTQRALLKRFPYSVFFLRDGDLLVITAIMHHRREPT